MITTSDDASRHSRARAAGLLAAGLLPWLAGSAEAVELSLADDQIKGALDTTVSYGQMWRTGTGQAQ